MARKKSEEQIKKDTIILRCAPEVKAAVEKLAAAENRSLANYIETMLMDKVKSSTVIQSDNVDNVADATEQETEDNPLLNMKHSF